MTSYSDTWLSTGCLHPDHRGYFKGPAEYMKWYKDHGTLAGKLSSPVVAILLYRKHVITNQPYLAGLIRSMEAQGVIPVPIFINGIEAHTVVSITSIPPSCKACHCLLLLLLIFLHILMQLLGGEYVISSSSQVKTLCLPHMPEISDSLSMLVDLAGYVRVSSP